MEQLLSSSPYEQILSAPLPQRTDTYSPVPHKKVIDITLEALDKNNLTVVGQHYNSARKGDQAEGHYIIQGGDKEMNLKLIWHNSYDKSIPLRWACGANVIVCRNGMVKGDMGAIKRKHTGSILSEYEDMIQENVKRMGDHFETLRKDRERFKEIEITKTVCSELAGRLFIEDAIITSTQLNILAREIQNPSFNYNSKNSLWEMYNHTTVALKSDHPMYGINRHINVHNFFNKVADNILQ